MTRAKVFVVLVTILLAVGIRDAFAGASFSLNDTTLSIRDVLVVLTDEFFGGRTKALKILFTTEPLTRDDRVASPRDLGKARNDRHVYLVLMLDAAGAIGQVNLTIVVPGQTVTRTIAWRPDDLRRFASDYAYDGQRLRLRSTGTFSDPSSDPQPFRLTWNVDLDVPVRTP